MNKNKIKTRKKIYNGNSTLFLNEINEFSLKFQKKKKKGEREKIGGGGLFRDENWKKKS